MPGRNDAEMGPANSLHAPAYYSEYNERFDMMFCLLRTLPKKCGLEGIAATMKNHHIQGLICIGGFEVILALERITNKTDRPIFETTPVQN